MEEGDKFNRGVFWLIVLMAVGSFLFYRFNEASKYKQIRVTTCGHVVDKIMDGSDTFNGEYHVYTDYRTIVYEDKNGKRYTYSFGEEEREDFYKIKIGEVFCASHSETVKIKKDLENPY